MTDEFTERKRSVLAPLFFEAGAALYDSQAFEYALVYLLWLISQLGALGLNGEEKFDPRRAAAIMDNDEQKTAGQVLGLLKRYVGLRDTLSERLTAALKARNQIVHRFFTDNMERMGQIDEHQKLVEEVRALRTDVQRGLAELDLLIKTFAKIHEPSIDFDVTTKDAREQFMRSTTK